MIRRLCLLVNERIGTFEARHGGTRMSVHRCTLLTNTVLCTILAYLQRIRTHRPRETANRSIAYFASFCIQSAVQNAEKAVCARLTTSGRREHAAPRPAVAPIIFINALVAGGGEKGR